jgi:RNA polymerase sigma-70 factor (ECF subfamily)
MKIGKANCAHLSDAEIIHRSQQNIDYFACLYDRYSDQLKRYIIRFSSASAEEAEDILQEAFIKVWKNLNAFDSSLKLSSWLYRIVHNETISFLRGKQSYGKNNTVMLDERAVIHLQTEMEWEADPETIARQIHEVFNRMPEKYRQFLVLKFIEKLSYEEISDILKLPEGTVATRINRAKKLFRKIADNENILFNR